VAVEVRGGAAGGGREQHHADREHGRQVEQQHEAEAQRGQQQQLAIAGQAATNQGVIQIYSVDTMAGAVATSKIAQSDVPDNMLSLLTALRAVGPGSQVS